MSQRRYPGAKPFTREQETLFYGRDKDVAQLYQLVSLESLVVLYGKSGLGKSSLINAGLRPKLEAEGLSTPLPLRFQAWTPDNEQSPLDRVATALQELDLDTKVLDRLTPGENGLWYLAKAHQFAHPNARLVLLFDQFEELFSYPEADIQNFKYQLAELVRNQVPERYEQLLEIAASRGEEPLSPADEDQLYAPLNLRILLSIRSDRLHLLDQLSDYLPTVLKNNYELQALTVEDARRALLLPAQLAGDFLAAPFTYSEDATNYILDFLRDDESDRVEAIQLQILCTSFEDKAIAEGITQFDRRAIGDLDTIIDHYYHNQLAKIEDPAECQAACRLLEDGLLDKERQQRLTLHESQIADLFQVTPALLDQLVNSNLCRRQPDRRQGYTYELSHDTLIAPALAARELREREEAETARIRQQKALEAERRKRRRANIRAGILGIISLLAIIALFWATQESKRARQAEQKAEQSTKEALVQAQRADSLRGVSEQSLQRAKEAQAATELEKNKAEAARKTAELNELRAIEAEKDARSRAENAERLRNTMVGEEDPLAYLLEQGHQLFGQGKYRDALTYWANARFLEPDERDINPLITLAETGVRSENHFRDGYFAEATKGFSLLSKADQVDATHAEKRLRQIPNSLAVWKAAIGNQDLAAIDSLHLTGDLVAVPAEASQITRLKWLIIENNKEDEIFLAAFTGTVDSIRLEHVGFPEFPQSLFRLTGIKKLQITNADRLNVLTDSISLLKELSQLEIRSNAQLQALPESIGQLADLSQLEIRSNDQLQALPESIGQLANLSQLDISDNDQLQALPESIGQLKKLKQLTISGSYNWYDEKAYPQPITQLPGTIGQLASLETLDLQVLQLPSLPPSLENLKGHLQTLNISYNPIPPAEVEAWRRRLPDTKVIFEQ